jgi:hypothetical protein
VCNLLPIPGYTQYFASRDGHIYSNRRGFLHKITERLHKGYLHVNINTGFTKATVKKEPVHKLILLAFKGLPKLNPFVRRHLDDNKRNNDIKNLSYGSNKQNYLDWIRNGNAKEGEQDLASKLTDQEVLTIRKLLLRGEKQVYIARLYNISQKHVSDIKLGRTRKLVTKGIALRGLSRSLQTYQL